jgi:hypothetical protein
MLLPQQVGKRSGQVGIDHRFASLQGAKAEV